MLIHIMQSSLKIALPVTPNVTSLSLNVVWFSVCEVTVDIRQWTPGRIGYNV